MPTEIDNASRNNCQCKRCGKEFYTRPSVIAKGKGKFCSWECLWPGTRDDRFWAKINKTDSCWLWTGPVNWKGYGSAYGGGNGPIGAHRRAWELMRGPIPPGMEVCHNCPGGDNKRCCNPDHLFLGTRKENAVDASKKGQMQRGEKRFNARLTESLVREILSEKGTKPQSAIAAKFGVHIMTVNDILCGRTWKHIERPGSAATTLPSQ